MFSQAFTNTNSSDIVNEIRSKGYYALEGALNTEDIDNLLKDINFSSTLVNNNDVGVVKTENNKYFTHCLASSKKAYDIITAPKVLDVCNNYFSDTFKLTNHRIYETCRSQHMPWHTDNNVQKGAEFAGKHLMPGLLFLIYLSDVDKNAFQIIKGSHAYSKKYFNERYLSDSYVERHYSTDIVSFPLKRGSIILSDIHGIHRAEPFSDSSYKRTSLLFQVDQVGSNNVGHGEKNLINTEYLENLTAELVDYLGFGFKRSYPAFPVSSVSTMTIHDIISLQGELLPKTVKGILKRLLKGLFPSSAIITIKRLRWRLNSRKAQKGNLY